MSKQVSEWKSTHNGKGVRKAPTRNPRKAPTRECKKAPTYYSTKAVVVMGVPGGCEEIRNRLTRKKLTEWSTTHRINGLSLLMNYFLRHSSAQRKGAKMALATSHEYAHPLKRCDRSGAILEPLKALVAIGLLEGKTPAVPGPNVKCSAAYIVPKEIFRDREEVELSLSPGQHRRFLDWEGRNERRQNRNHSFREALMQDLVTVHLSEEGQRIAHRLQATENKGPCTKRLLDAIHGETAPKLSIDPAGHITTVVSGCPKELKPHLTLGGRPTEYCDISSAHFCILPRILQNRIDYLIKNGAPAKMIRDHEKEATRLRDTLSKRDLYADLCPEGAEKEARKKAKGLALVTLNMETAKARRIGIYRHLAELFPLTFAGIEALKRKGNLHKQLRPHTATVIREALLALQAQGIPAIPDSDAMIVPDGKGKLACYLIGEAMFDLSGVKCLVGGRRFDPEKPSQYPPTEIGSGHEEKERKYR
ncbi:MAG: hypothetical protein O3A87_07545 [Verrucomicrobia bacterium]|nr:hypothetical protein [Verrucomicrobiota bacterium]